ncbi:hypothetical protein YC2023_083569 [Brassica napus]
MPDLVIVGASHLLSKIRNAKYSRIVTFLRFLTVLSSKPIGIFNRKPSSPYGNNSGYCRGKYAGCNSLIPCNFPLVLSRTISRVSIFKTKSPGIKAASTFAVGRLWVRPSDCRLSINLIL